MKTVFAFISLAALSFAVAACVSSPQSPADDMLPRITAFMPTEGNVGDVVTITGKNFGNDVAVVAVKFGESFSRPLDVSDSVMHVAVPRGAKSGPITAIVRRKEGESTSPFTVLFSYGNLSSISITFQNIGLIDRDSAQPDTVPLYGRSMEIAMSCDTNVCSVDSNGWVIKRIYPSGLIPYGSTSGGEEIITAVLDPAQRKIISLRYSYSQTWYTGQLSTEYGRSYISRSFTLAGLPYTLLPDGSMVFEVHGAAVTDYLRTMEIGESSIQNNHGSARTQYSSDIKLTTLQPKNAMVKIVVK